MGTFTKEMMINVTCFMDTRHFLEVWNEIIELGFIIANGRETIYSDIVGRKFEILRFERDVNACDLYEADYEEYREVFV